MKTRAYQGCTLETEHALRPKGINYGTVGDKGAGRIHPGVSVLRKQDI